jgi:hypothetical protein
MKIPKTLKIGAITYNIVIKDLDEDMGRTMFTNSTIFLDTKLSKEQMMVTLLHEIIHCQNNQLSEMEVEFLAQSTYQILKDNNFIK